jgi:hypothetical protein
MLRSWLAAPGAGQNRCAVAKRVRSRVVIDDTRSKPHPHREKEPMARLRRDAASYREPARRVLRLQAK